MLFILVFIFKLCFSSNFPFQLTFQIFWQILVISSYSFSVYTIYSNVLLYSQYFFKCLVQGLPILLFFSQSQTLAFVLVSYCCVTDYYKLGGLRQHNSIVLQFWKPEIQNQFHWAKVMVSAGLHSLWRL